MTHDMVFVYLLFMILFAICNLVLNRFGTCYHEKKSCVYLPFSNSSFT